MYQEGDIVLIDFPFTNLSETKVRPAIVISDGRINSTSDFVLLAITGTIRGDDFSFLLENEHLIEPMRKPSEVRCHKVFTANQDLIRKRINQLQQLSYQELFDKFVSILKM